MEKVKLGEIIEYLPKSKFKAGDGKERGKYKFFTSSNTQNKFIDEFTYNGEYLIFGTGGKASINYCNDKFSTSTDNFVIKVNNEFSTKLIFLYFKNDMQKLERGFKGASIKHISKEYINQLTIPKYNYKNQLEIVGKLEKIQEIIDIRKKQIEELDELIKSQFVEMFDDINKKKKIKEISTYFSRGKSPNYVELSSVGVINQACIYWNEFKLSNIKYQDELKISKSLDKLINNRDVLITSTGTGTLGRCNVYSGISGKYIADGHVSILRLNEKELAPIFFKYYFMQEKIQRKLYLECVNGSTNQIELSKDKFLNFSVIVPKIELQNQFAEFVKQTNKQKLELQKNLEQMQKLQESLMNEYFG